MSQTGTESTFQLIAEGSTKLASVPSGGGVVVEVVEVVPHPQGLVERRPRQKRRRKRKKKRRRSQTRIWASGFSIRVGLVWPVR